MNRLLVVSVAIALSIHHTAAGATEGIRLHLYQRVEHSDTIVVARITDPQNGLASVERVLKGQPPRQIRLVRYVDTFSRPAQQRPLVKGASELLFLQASTDGYAPLQEQLGRFLLNGNTLVDRSLGNAGSLTEVAKSISSLVQLQARAAGGGARAEQAYVTALRSSVVDIRLWAEFTAYQQVSSPSKELVDAYLALWSNREATGSVANAVITWRLRQAAPLLSQTLTRATDDEHLRATAARGLGGTGDRTFLPLLRQTATSDVSEIARGYAYEGIGHLLGPESLDDLTAGARDSSDFVRSNVAGHAFNVARRANRADVSAEVQRLLETLRMDPSPRVSMSARSLLASLAKLPK